MVNKVLEGVEAAESGCLIISTFLANAVDEILRVFGTHLNLPTMAIIALVPTALFAYRIRSFGRPAFIFLMLVMILLATTEIATDSWIGALMTPVLKSLGSNPGNSVLIYTSTIMFIMRFCAGPIVHRLSPLGLLTVGSAVASTGLFCLSHAGAVPILSSWRRPAAARARAFFGRRLWAWSRNYSPKGEP
jgi:hypothetical protein